MSLRTHLYKSLSGSSFVVHTARKLFANRLLNDSSLYGAFCCRMARRFHAERPHGSLNIHVETTSFCNARCLMCTKTSCPINDGRMSDTLFQQIIGEAKAGGVKSVCLSVYGEPLMDPHFLDRARLVEEAGLDFRFFTNVSLLDENMSLSLLQFKHLKWVNFSINGFSQEVFERISRGLRKNTVYENALRFLELRKRLRPDLRVVVSCVLFGDNMLERRAFRNFWGNKADIELTLPRNRAGTPLDAEATGYPIEFSPLAEKDHKLLPCKYLWEDLFIYWNGDVGVCCEDVAARRLVIGNLREQSLMDIWEGPELQRLRELHLKGQRHLHPVCGKACSYNTIWLKPAM